jgi:1-acyl-sn-glycerol-3-phosphate acyltransferase
VLIFPEGTTSRGGPPILFRRAGFRATVDAAAVIVPVSVDYLDRHGSRTVDPAFVGDELGSIWRVMCAAPVVADVTWLPIVPAIQDRGHRTSHRAPAAGRQKDQ